MVTTGYNLSRAWFAWAFQNSEKVSPNHTALYFWCTELCNRLGWKEKFTLPTDVAKEAIGIKSYKTYIKTLHDLQEFGFIKIVQRSNNQYTANIIALVNFTNADTKPLDKAILNHDTEQCSSTIESTVESNATIDKPETTNHKPLTTNNKHGHLHDEKNILTAEEIKWKLVAADSDIAAFICTTYKFSKEQYWSIVDRFLGEKTSGVNELNKPYAEVIKQFKNWVRYHQDNLRKQPSKQVPGPGYVPLWRR